MELEILKQVMGLGIGAVFGLVVFFMSRQDSRDYIKRSEDLTRTVNEDRKEITSKMFDVLEREVTSREDLSKSICELTILLQKINGKTQ